MSNENGVVRASREAAYRAFNAGDMELAETSFRRLVEHDPDNAAAWNDLGVVLRRRGKPRDALSCYLKALWQDSTHPEYYVNLANALVDAGRASDATSCYGRAAELLSDPRRVGDAIAVCNRALKLDPHHLNIRRRLAVLLIRSGRYDDALKQLDYITETAQFLRASAQFLSSGETVATVRFEAHTLLFRVYKESHNLGITSFHANGVLFEAEELAHCRRLVPPGAVVLDIGANIGNHLVFFARVLGARQVIPVEPHPEAIRQLRENIALNGIDCVDARFLGVGVGKTRGYRRLVENVDLARARLEDAPSAGIEVIPIDDMIQSRVDFIKIDVESAEIDVLNGARRVIREYRPSMMVEVAEENLLAFRSVLGEIGYRVERTFAHGSYANIFIVPGSTTPSRYRS